MELSFTYPLSRVQRSCYLLLIILIPICSGIKTADCSCGFYDASLQGILTDSTIVYFNETEQLPSDLVIEDYQNKYDFGWNTLYREGAGLGNVEIGNDTTADNLQSLRMFCDPSDANHLVMGSSIRTARRDIFFGSFRAYMRSPRHWFPGSALSMLVDHNRTESWDVDLMNTQNSTDAWVSTLMEGQFPNRWFGVNYTTLEANGQHPWNYTEYRVDWTRDEINFYIGGQIYRSITTKENGTLPSTPTPLKFKHWSSGNKYSSAGPPYERGEANVAWMRLFFNSSVTTPEQSKAFDERCKPSDACLMDDVTLRGSTEYSEASLDQWKQTHPKPSLRWVPICIDIALGSLSTLLLLKTLQRRIVWGRLKDVLFCCGNRGSKPPSNDSSSFVELVRDSEPGSKFVSGTVTPTLPSGMQTPASWAGARTPKSFMGMGTPIQYPDLHIPEPRYATQARSETSLLHDPFRGGANTSNNVDSPHDARESWPKADASESPSGVKTGGKGLTDRNSADIDSARAADSPAYSIDVSEDPVVPSIAPENMLLSPVAEAPPRPGEINAEVKDNKAQLASQDIKPGGQAGPLLAQQRIDYLAGFIALSALLVTANHFGLTYFAAVIIPSVEPHYQSEIWARKTIGSLFLDPLWIGPFLMISTRFLVSNYIRTGNLSNMAQKIVSRPFRLLSPVVFIALLEYLLMDTGAINWLEYLPSVTWSSWPFTSIPHNFGTFLSEILQLAYFIPNGAPQIIYYYCTGVLWTIPVQLQGAWQTLLAVIMIREIKNPWKRFGFYAVCITMHWYALSWGSYYYCGVLLTDLDITYKYTKWLWARPKVYYPLLAFVCIVALAGFAIDTVTQWTHVNYAAYEYSWHPDITSGLSIAQAGKFTYPDFYIPRLNGLISTVFMQTIVEISPMVQKFMSLKFWRWIFPHIFTIYLIHGFIFWSIGSWVCVSLFAQGLPWWLVVLCTAICCYGSLFIVIPLLTPFIEAIGKGLTNQIWENASQQPVPKRPTLYPFDQKVFDAALPEAVNVAEAGPYETVEKDVQHTIDAAEKDTTIVD